MKNDLATSIIAAIIGILVAYFACSAILPEIEGVNYKTLSSSITYNLSEPDPEVFNFRAVNPTVEVYVGQCEEYNANNECVKVVDNDSLNNGQTNQNNNNTNNNNTNNNNTDNTNNQPQNNNQQNNNENPNSVTPNPQNGGDNPDGPTN